jgi:acyl-CoA thioesterase
MGTELSFTDVTAVAPHPSIPNRFVGHLPPRWNTPVGVHGGMLAGIAARAGLAGLSRPDLRVRALHAVFLAPPTYDLSFEVDVIRQGRGSAHVRVHARGSDGRAALDLTMVLTSDRPSPAFLDAEPPAVPGPDEVAPLGEPPEAVAGLFTPPPLFDQLDLRTVLGTTPWSADWSPGQPAHHIRWGRWRVPPLLPDGRVDPLALLPLADLPGPSIWQRFGPDEPVLFFMSLDLSLNLLEPVPDEWVLTDIRARRLGQGHAYVDTDLWSGGRLVATSSQTMMMRRPAPDSD